jgi:AcrR family transcriptional regulator
MAGTRPKGSAKRTLLLDTAEQLMVREGYAAVTTRRVALEAGVKPPLVHYYFPATDDLLLAMYKRSAERAHDRTLEALAAEAPLEALWRLGNDAEHARLGAELVALANHRMELRSEIVRTAESFRAIQTEALRERLGAGLDAGAATGLLVLITGMSRMLVQEEAMGVSGGHADARAIVDGLLQQVAKREDRPAARDAKGALTRSGADS